jgi:hypothetical protein
MQATTPRSDHLMPTLEATYRREALEEDLVTNFGLGLATQGLSPGRDGLLRGFIVGMEVALVGASANGNMGAADLLMVTEDGRWWLIEAKLAASSESRPDYLFGNQLARYAQAIEDLGIRGLHSRLESYLYGRRRGLRPPETLLEQLERSTDIVGALTVWCDSLSSQNADARAKWLVAMLEGQIAARTITLAGLVDVPDHRHQGWIAENCRQRSLALLTVAGGRPSIVYDGLAALPSGERTMIDHQLPRFDLIPQSYKPTPRTLPRMLSKRAFELYCRVLEPRLARWTDDKWPDVELSVVTSAAFSLDLRSEIGREICLQIGRSALAGGGRPGEHPMKMIVNMIWAAEQVYATWTADAAAAEAAYRDLETLICRLCSSAGMLVRGVRRDLPSLGQRWWDAVRTKMRGDARRRPELVAVREVGEREGYSWFEGDEELDARLLTETLDAVEVWLGPGPYVCVPRRETGRAVPGLVR